MALEDQAEVRRGRDRMLQASTYGKEELVTVTEKGRLNYSWDGIGTGREDEGKRDRNYSGFGQRMLNTG